MISRVERGVRVGWRGGKAESQHSPVRPSSAWTLNPSLSPLAMISESLLYSAASVSMSVERAVADLGNGGYKVAGLQAQRRDCAGVQAKGVVGRTLTDSNQAW